MKPLTAIAIDGPAASGKTTVGRMLAETLEYLFLDTGCMYRAVTLAALQRGVDVMDETAVTQLAQSVDIDIQSSGNHGDGRAYTVLLDGEDVTWAIRTPEVDGNVSQVSKYAGVRDQMVRQQHLFGERGHVVAVGRDIGTVVMPEAALKLFITATPEERARRRTRDRREQGHAAEYDVILADVKRRDAIDSNREHSPLRPADDAVIMDSTGRTPADIVADIVAMLPAIRALQEA